MTESQPLRYGEYLAWCYIDWRWRRVMEVIHGDDELEHGTDDAWVLKAARHLERSRQNAVILPEEQAIDEAVDFANGESLERDILEARLLALQTHDQVAAVSKLSAAAIEAYEMLFFNFRPFIDARSWINIHAIRVCYEPEPITVGSVIRKYAYFGGIHALEPVIGVLRKLEGPTLGANLPDLTTPEGQLELNIRKALAIDMLPGSAFEKPAMMRQWLRERRRQLNLQHDDDYEAETIKWLNDIAIFPLLRGRMLMGYFPKAAA